MTSVTNQIIPLGLPAPGFPARATGVPPLGLTQGGLQAQNFTAVSNTYYLVDGSGITLTGPASPAAADVLVIAIGGSAVVFNPNGNRVNGQTGSITLLAYNTYLMTYVDATSGWC